MRTKKEYDEFIKGRQKREFIMLSGFVVEVSSFFATGFFFSRGVIILSILYLLLGFYMAYLVGKLIGSNAIYTYEWENKR